VVELDGGMQTNQNINQIDYPSVNINT
jgi:hypothetical protein